jgi:dTDP-4-amino-4,6-dideoxygalactose transaminase
VTDSASIAEQIRFLRQYGWHTRYISEQIGTNSRLDELQAALLSVQLKYLDQDLLRKKNIAERYLSSLHELPITLPCMLPGASHSYHQFTIRVSASQREPLRSHLEKMGVVAPVLYPLPIHRQPAYSAVASKYAVDRQHSELACESLLCLPIHPLLTEEEVNVVIQAIRQYPW